jgi:hydroxypyruvate isomerase
MTQRFVANCSTLFTELPLLRRPAAASAAGFTEIEFWWPWPHCATPPDRDIDAFASAIERAGVRLVGLNLFAGDLSSRDAGVLSLPERRTEFTDSVEVAMRIGERLGVCGFNALYGTRIPDMAPQDQDAVATDNLRYAARAAARIDAAIWVEPLSGRERYPIRTAADAAEVIARVRGTDDAADNVRLLADVYHLASNGDDVPAALTEHAALLGHVQFADAPGRGVPGSGRLPFTDYLRTLDRVGYRGRVALEFLPNGSTTDDLARMDLRGTA